MGRKNIFLFFLILIESFFNKSFAQICQGSFGDPVVKIDFGRGESFFGPSIGGNTNYTYVPSEGPGDGYYTIVKGGSPGISWHGFSNHTPNDPYGYVMMVNASHEPGIFYETEVLYDLCPNTTYEFAAWVINLMRYQAIRPNLSFSILTLDNQLLAPPYNTGDIPETSSATWKQYGFLFSTTTTSTRIKIRITNNAPGGGGNDLAIDDITFRPCGPLVSASIDNNGDSIKVCPNDTRSFSFTGTVLAGYNNPTLQWQLSIDSGKTWKDIAGANSLTYLRSPTQTPGVYQYRLSVSKESNILCRVQSEVLVIVVLERPTANAGPDYSIVQGQTVRLKGKAGVNDYTYWWTPDLYLSSDSILSPIVSTSETTVYTLHVRSNAGCGTALDDAVITVYKDIYIPTAFTPNNDGLNDSWRIKALESFPNAEVKIFNRWGEMVYQVRGNIVNWDGSYNGSVQSSGVFCYVVDPKDGRPILSGVVTLIR